MLITVIGRASGRFRRRHRGTSHEALDTCGAVPRGEAGIPERHRHSLVPHQLPDGREVKAFRRQTASEGVSEAMEAEIFDPSDAETRRKGLGSPEIAVVFAVGEYERVAAEQGRP